MSTIKKGFLFFFTINRQKCILILTVILLLLSTFSAHARVVARDAKEMRNTRDTRGLALSPLSLGGSSYFLWNVKTRRFLTDEK